MVEFLAATFGIAGALLVSLKKKSGFICWIIGNLLWIYIGFSTNQIGLIAQFIVYTVISIFGYINWGKKS